MLYLHFICLVLDLAFIQTVHGFKVANQIICCPSDSSSLYWPFWQIVIVTVEDQTIETNAISCSCLLEIRIQSDKNNIIHPKA